MLEPQSWPRGIAREWLIALGCVLLILTLDGVVLHYAFGGLDGHYSPTGPNVWAQFAEDFKPFGVLSGGYFWYWVLGLYAAVQIVRLTVWAIRTAAHRRPD